MKKNLYISFVAIIILANIFVGECILKFETYHLLYSEPSISVQFSNPNIKESTISGHLNKFSKENRINISQYIYIDQNRLHIYSTNIEEDSKIKLKSGSYPERDQYISNVKKNALSENQVGMFHYPITNLKINIYNYNQIKNVGISDIFYLRNSNEDIKKQFIKEFSKYGEVSDQSEKILYLAMINKTLLSILAFAILAFIMITFLMIIKNRKELVLKELWGYSKRHLLIVNFSKVFKFITFIMSMGILVLLILISKYSQTYYRIKYLLYFIIMNSLLVLSIILLVHLESLIVKKLSSTSLSIKDKLPFEKLYFLSIVFKILVYIIVISVIISTLTNLKSLNSNLENFNEWEKTKNVYRISVSNIPKYKLNDLGYERDLNDKSYEFYKEIQKNNQGFLMHSNNFHYTVNGDKINYFYSINTMGEEVIYSPYGRSVIIDTSYLNVNPIESFSGDPIERLIVDDEDVLNVLVPKKYKKYEGKIKENYREDFYFEKVEVENMFNREFNTPLNLQSIESLKVNVIYVKNNQDYFTFNPVTGGLKSTIEDPVAVIYNESVDTSNIGAYLTTSVYIIDKTKGRALESIRPSLKKTKLTEVRRVQSVYSSINSSIIRQKNKLMQQIISLIIGGIIALIFIILLVWANYQIDLYKITVKYMLGFSSIRRNYKLLLAAAVSNLIVGLIVWFFYKNKIIIPIILGITLFELLLIIVLGNRYLKNNVQKISKGDNI